MPHNVQLHDIPDELYERIRVSALREGVSMRTFMLSAAKGACALSEARKLNAAPVERPKPHYPNRRRA